MKFGLCCSLLLILLVNAWAEECVQGQNCQLPDCFCATLEHPLGAQNIPQIVYFGFDDAVQPQVDSYYKQLFTEDKKNPNGCPITMSLYVSDQYTVYSMVSDYYKKGNEIAVHSVTHTDIDTAEKLQREATEQKQNIETEGGVPPSDVVGWRSPNLKTAGDDQPWILGQLNYLYDISLTYSKDKNYPWPFTLDYGFPYSCVIPPCPSPTTVHKGFWEVMVHSFTDPATGIPCGYVDGCRPQGEDAALEYLWSNFLDTYETTRAPFGLNMHAAWFATPEYLSATNRFIDRLLQTPDVYIVNVRQMLEWMKNPVPTSEIKTFGPWSCGQTTMSSTTVTTTSTPTTKTTRKTISTTTTTTKPPPTKTTDGPIPRPVMSSNQARPQGNGINSSRSKPSSYLSWYRQNHQPNREPFLRLNPSTRATTPPTKTSLAPAVNISHFSQNIPKDTIAQRQINPNRCLQEVNCFKPKCYCRTSNPPHNMPAKETLQIVYLAIDTRIDGRTFAPLVNIFSQFRKNQNGCPITGTVFIPSTGNYAPYVNVLRARGVRVGVRGGTYAGHFYGDDLVHRVKDTISRTAYSTSTNYGWRGLANMAPTDEIFKTLQNSNVTFDSSVITDNVESTWPYTLDYGLKDKCTFMSSQCPNEKYPGLWEVPVRPLLSYGHVRGCVFLDTCPGAVSTEEEAFQLLYSNFKRHYDGERVPFGINLRSSWLSNADGGVILRGLTRFIDTALRVDNVVITSVEQMLEWIISPVRDSNAFPC